jgi:cell division protein ZapA
MSANNSTVNVNILDRDYQVACKPEERDALLNSARYLNDKMREIKASGSVIGVERIAVMAALNMAHELLQEGSERGANDAQLQRLTEKISRALGGQSRLQL